MSRQIRAWAIRKELQSIYDLREQVQSKRGTFQNVYLWGKTTEQRKMRKSFIGWRKGKV